VTAAPRRPGRSRHRWRALRIGLTGPIGCGKSTVAGWLAGQGAAVIDADAIARDVTAPGQPVHEAILEAFGPAVRGPDGALDRAALAAIVFSDPERLRELEALVHPAVRPPLRAAVAAAEAAGAAVVVIEAIKLVESGLAELCDETWLVTCNPADQLARLGARGYGAADAVARVAAQGDIRGRLAAVASRVIDTSGPARLAREQVEAALAAASSRRRQARAVRPQ
jgi:dephospho-CoA kinase